MTGKIHGMFLPVILISVPTAIFANGGPIDASPVQQVGDIQLTREQEISLDEEILAINLYGDFVNVRVRYTFTNHGPPQTVYYAFPLDYFEYSEIDWMYGEEGWQSECIPYFRIADENGELDVEIVEGTDSIIGEQWDDHTVYWQRMWFKTFIRFPADTTKEVTVSYRVKAEYSDGMTNKDFMPGYGYRTFRYDLNPSSYWGDGTVASFKVIVDARAELNNGTWFDTLILPGDPLKDNGVFTYEASNLNLAGADDILLRYSNAAAKYHQFFDEGRAGPEHIVAIRASSAVEGYPAENLVDGDPATAWVEGERGAGFGQFIEVRFRDFALVGVAILNGYTKSADVYYKNNRVHKVKFEILNSSGELMFEGRDAWSLPDKSYSEFDPDIPWGFASIIDAWSEDWSPIIKDGTVRITILETHPGSTYDDTAISELLLLRTPPGFWDQ